MGRFQKIKNTAKRGMFAVFALLMAAAVFPAQALAVTSTQSIALPLYEYPTVGTLWPDVQTAGGSQVPFAIVNPASGPGVSVNSDYTTAIGNNTTAGIRSIGYVDTNYQSRSYTDVIADVDTWYTLYPDVTGIFLDRVSAVGATELCYSSYIYNYIKTRHPTALVSQNFGTYTSPSYEPYGDIFVNAEMDHALYQTWILPTDGFQDNAANSNRFWHLIHTTNGADLSSTLTQTRNNNAGWVYITDDILPNPYDATPSYWSSLLTGVGTLPPSSIPNRGVTQLPAGCADVDSTVSSSTATGTQQTVTANTITLTNSSSTYIAQTPMKVAFSLPNGVSLQNASGSGWTCTSNECLYASSLAASASAPDLAVEFAVSCSYGSGNATITTTNFAGNASSDLVTLTAPSDCPTGSGGGSQTSGGSAESLAGTGANAVLVTIFGLGLVVSGGVVLRRFTGRT